MEREIQAFYRNSSLNSKCGRPILIKKLQKSPNTDPLLPPAAGGKAN